MYSSCRPCLVLIAVLFFQTAYAAVKKPSVRVEAIKAEELSDRLIYPATLSAFRVVPLHSDADGLVSQLNVELGQKVSSGQALALIKNPDPVYDFKPFALTAPFSGIITSVDIAVGDRVSKSRPVLTLADLRSIKIKIHLTAEDLAHLKPQHPGNLSVHGKEFAVRIRAMSPMIDPGTGTAPCELELADSKAPYSALIPGSLGQVVFEANRRKGIMVPEQALVFRGRDPFVIRVSPQKTAQYVAVKVLKQGVGRLEVETTLKDGDTIVSSSTGYIVEGESLDIEGDTPAAAAGSGKSS